MDPAERAHLLAVMQQRSEAARTHRQAPGTPGLPDVSPSNQQRLPRWVGPYPGCVQPGVAPRACCCSCMQAGRLACAAWGAAGVWTDTVTAWLLTWACASGRQQGSLWEQAGRRRAADVSPDDAMQDAFSAESDAMFREPLANSRSAPSRPQDRDMGANAGVACLEQIGHTSMRAMWGLMVRTGSCEHRLPQEVASAVAGMHGGAGSPKS